MDKEKYNETKLFIGLSSLVIIPMTALCICILFEWEKYRSLKEQQDPYTQKLIDERDYMMQRNDYKTTKKFFDNLRPEDIKKINTFDSLATQKNTKPINTRVEPIYF